MPSNRLTRSGANRSLNPAMKPSVRKREVLVHSVIDVHESGGKGAEDEQGERGADDWFEEAGPEQRWRVKNPNFGEALHADENADDASEGTGYRDQDDDPTRDAGDSSVANLNGLIERHA